MSTCSVGRTTVGGSFSWSTPLTPTGLPWGPARPRFLLSGLAQIDRATGARPFVLAFGKQKFPGDP